jgi:hypothetical protein
MTSGDIAERLRISVSYVKLIASDANLKVPVHRGRREWSEEHFKQIKEFLDTKRFRPHPAQNT